MGERTDLWSGGVVFRGGIFFLPFAAGKVPGAGGKLGMAESGKGWQS